MFFLQLWRKCHTQSDILKSNLQKSSLQTPNLQSPLNFILAVPTFRNGAMKNSGIVVTLKKFCSFLLQRLLKYSICFQIGIHEAIEFLMGAIMQSPESLCSFIPDLQFYKPHGLVILTLYSLTNLDSTFSLQNFFFLF